MKAFIVFLAAVVCCCVAGAQVPRKLNYQGYLTGPAGAPINAASLTIVFNIYNVAIDGVPMHTEMQSVAVSNGIFNVLLGTSPALTLPFDAPYYLGIAVGSDPEMTPRQPLAAAPYALRAVIAENAALAQDASMLGGFTPAQFVQTTDPRLADARPPTAGSASYIQNTTSPQASSNFNISGDGLVGGALGVGTAGSGSKLTVAGMIESTGGGVKFPDGSVLATAKSLAQIATLRWHDTIQTGAAFTVPDNPYGIAFDGASLWVTSRGTNTVVKLRASDGASIGIFATGSDPRGIAFDGNHIWVANLGGNTVTKLRASDGACAGVIGPPTAACTFSVGAGPIGIAFDGANVWVTNFGGGSGTTVTRLRASDGACVGTCTFNVISGPNGIAFDGTNVWIANYGGSTNSVTRLRASDGACVGTCTFATGSTPYAVAFDGNNIWITNAGGGNVTRLRASDGACVSACIFPVGSGPSGIAFDGTSIWVTNSIGNSVTRLRASDGACVGVCTFAVGSNPVGIAFDGVNILVANHDSGTLQKL